MSNSTEWTCPECGKGNLADPSTLKHGSVVQCQACGTFTEVEHLGLVPAEPANRDPKKPGKKS